MDQNLEAWRHFERQHIEAQTYAQLEQARTLQSIRTYVAVFFWMTMISAFLIGLVLINAEPAPVYYGP